MAWPTKRTWNLAWLLLAAVLAARGRRGELLLFRPQLNRERRRRQSCLLLLLLLLLAG